MWKIRQPVASLDEGAKHDGSSTWIKVSKIVKNPKDLAERQRRPNDLHVLHSGRRNSLALGQSSQPIPDLFVWNALPSIDFRISEDIKTRFFGIVKRGLENRFFV